LYGKAAKGGVAFYIATGQEAGVPIMVCSDKNEPRFANAELKFAISRTGFIFSPQVPD
jgi:hypothetical protein